VVRRGDEVQFDRFAGLCLSYGPSTSVTALFIAWQKPSGLAGLKDIMKFSNLREAKAVRSLCARALSHVTLVAMLVSSGIGGAQGQAKGDEVSALRHQFFQLYGEHNAEATPIAERLLALTECTYWAECQRRKF
jgi:hypothetical protein